MIYGRKSSSLFGAALLISAIFNGENVQTFNICQIYRFVKKLLEKDQLNLIKQDYLNQLENNLNKLFSIETEVSLKIIDSPSFKRLRKKRNKQKRDQQKININNYKIGNQKRQWK